jgi:hypothetical protein
VIEVLLAVLRFFSSSDPLAFAYVVVFARVDFARVSAELVAAIEVAADLTGVRCMTGIRVIVVDPGIAGSITSSGGTLVLGLRAVLEGWPGPAVAGVFAKLVVTVVVVTVVPLLDLAGGVYPGLPLPGCYYPYGLPRDLLPSWWTGPQEPLPQEFDPDPQGQSRPTRNRRQESPL